MGLVDQMTAMVLHQSCCETVIIFVNIDKFSCHCVLIYSNFHRQVVVLCMMFFVLFLCIN